MKIEVRFDKRKPVIHETNSTFIVWILLVFAKRNKFKKIIIHSDNENDKYTF